MKRYMKFIVWFLAIVLFAWGVSFVYSIVNDPTPKELEAALTDPACFYNGESGEYTMPGLTFGQDVYTTIEELGLDKMYTDEYLELLIGNYLSTNGNTDSSGGLRGDIPIAALDAKYTLKFAFTPNLKCYLFGLVGSFVNFSKSPHEEQNLMHYDEACQYFSNLYDEFVLTYGEPCEKDFSTDLSQITIGSINEGYFPRQYACWESGDLGEESILQLRAHVFESSDIYDNPVLFLIVTVTVAQANEEIPIEMIREELAY